jgi:hypothetical protein
MKIVYSIKTVIPSEDVNLSLIDDRCMTVARWRRWIVYWQYFCPLVSIKIKFEKVISAISTIITSKYVEFII